MIRYCNSPFSSNFNIKFMRTLQQQTGGRMSLGREDLIHSLAKSMGMGDAQKTKIASGKYNVDSGTIFSNGHVITKHTIEQSRLYFLNQYRKLAEKDDEGAKELAAIYEVAFEAISMMVESGKPSDS